MSAKILGAGLLLMLAATSVIWYAVVHEDRGTLNVSFLNVGQGDAILVRTSSGRSILIDGGPDNSVLRELGAAMPFYDRSLDIAVVSALLPQKIGGLTDVLLRYNTSMIVRSAARSSAPQVQSIDGAIAHAQQGGSRLIVVKRGDVIDLDEETFVEFYFPDRDVSQMSAGEGCLMFKLVFGKTSFFFACGSSALETYLATLDGAKLHADVLFATGNDPELFTGFVSPLYAIVPCRSASSSAMQQLNVQTFDTCKSTVTFVSDGQSVVIK